MCVGGELDARRKVQLVMNTRAHPETMNSFHLKIQFCNKICSARHVEKCGSWTEARSRRPRDQRPFLSCLVNVTHQAMASVAVITSARTGVLLGDSRDSLRVYRSARSRDNVHIEPHVCIHNRSNQCVLPRVIFPEVASRECLGHLPNHHEMSQGIDLEQTKTRSDVLSRAAGR